MSQNKWTEVTDEYARKEIEYLIGKISDLEQDLNDLRAEFDGLSWDYNHAKTN